MQGDANKRNSKQLEKQLRYFIKQLIYSEIYLSLVSSKDRVNTKDGIFKIAS